MAVASFGRAPLLQHRRLMSSRAALHGPCARPSSEARGLVERGYYFAIHAPRQTGKTTTIRALAADLTASGRFAAVVFSCEAGERRA